MTLFSFNALAVLAGIFAMLIAAFLRFHLPFRYRYLCLIVRKKGEAVKRLLERSYQKNRSVVGILDKSTKELLEGNYEKAQHFILEGISQAKKRSGFLNRFVLTLLFCNLSWIFYYKGQFKESLQIALQIYERNPFSPHMIALISCNFARLGEIQEAVEAYAKLEQMKKAKPSLLLPCQAEIEAAKGNVDFALQLYQEASQRKENTLTSFTVVEINNRMTELKKPA
jgi:tetratricopeptide (TPR) repeat protein